MKRMKILLLLLLMSIVTTHVKAEESDLYFNKKVKGSFENVVETVKAELKIVGFGIVSETDMDKKLKEKLDVKIKPYKILGACNIKIAQEALETESNVGIFLPCKIIIKQLDEGVVEVVIANPATLLKQFGNKDLDKIGMEVTELLKTVIDKL